MTAAVPGPRFRDQVALTVIGRQLADRYGAPFVKDKLAQLITEALVEVAAEMEARVQAAARQQAALRELLTVLDSITVGRKPQALEDAMETARAALAHPAPQEPT